MSWSVRILDDDEDDDEPREEEPPREPRRRRRWRPSDPAGRVALVVAAVVLLGTGAWVAADRLGYGADLELVDVGSYWDDADLECRTMKLSEGRRSVETFRCEPTGNVEPPAGRYTQAATTWQSDIDRRAAVAHDIVITRDGVVSGWALY